MKFQSLVSSGANSSFSHGQSGSYKRKRKSPSREDNKKDLKENMLPKNFKQKLLTYSSGQSKVIDDLPPAILADIISRLPLESIFESTLVSKKWYQLTRDPYFIKLQLKRSKPKFLFQPLLNSLYHLALLDNINTIYLGEARKFSQIPVTEQLSRQYKVMCSFNGLLCMAPRYLKPDPLCLYNPITRAFMVLPKSGLRRVLSEYVVCLSSDSNGRYKILRHYTQKYGAKESRLEILSLGDSSWRQLSGPGPGPDWYARTSKFRNGVFFIIMQKVCGFEMCFTAIDMNDEKIQIIHFREVVPIQPSVVEFMEVEGILGTTEIFNNEKISWQSFLGNKVGEFSLRHLGTYNYRHRFEKPWIEIWLKGYKYLKQINSDKHFVMVEMKDNSSSIEYKKFDYKPSFVNPIAESLLSWPPIEQNVHPDQAQS